MKSLERMPNILYDTHAAIGLTRGKYALIDLEDYDRIDQYVWAYHKSLQERAVRYEGRRTIYMHHDVLEITGEELRSINKEADHLNGDTLDNRRTNLRIVTHHENMQNTARHINSVGVCFHRASGLYIAYVSFPDNGRVSLGYWKTRERAMEISSIGKELQKNSSSISDFRTKWKVMRPRRSYDKGGM